MKDTISLAAMVDRLAHRVCVCIGLDPQMVRGKISRYLGDISPEERLTLLQIADTESFSMPPWERFVESLLVHETYFFRHPEQLLYLRDRVLADYLAERPRQKTLLLWCAGASTGEDAYTFAFLASEVLAQAGLDPYGFELLATDLSEACLNQAGTGQFQLQPGFGSFRTIPEFAQHHFHGLSVPGASEWVVPDPTRRRVRVERHNLLDPPPILSVDILICRNTLIYFTTEARQRVLQAMSHALIPGGVLILGPADDASCVAGLERWGANAPFIFRKCVDPATLAPKKTGEPARISAGETEVELLVIGVSTGGPDVLAEIFRHLHPLRVPMLIAQHMPADHTASFAAHLAREFKIPIVECGDGPIPPVGSVGLLKGGRDFVLKRFQDCLTLRPIEASGTNSHPNIDTLLRSAAKAGIKALPIILTGMGRDGASGSKLLEDQGMPVWVQTPASCTVAGMPLATLEEVSNCAVLAPDAVARRLNNLYGFAETKYSVKEQGRL